MRLRQTVAGALAPLRQKLRQRSVNVQLPIWNAHDDSMFTDEHLLEQALYNLLLNAVEASPANSTVEMQVEFSQEWITLRIADRGPGMPFTPDPRCISPGPTTKRFGTGLGIPFAFKVCEALGGELSFGARKDCGTSTQLRLPRRCDLG
jgi:signal transduction histidine kinase